MGQNIIKAERGRVVCECDPELAELQVWRGVSPVEGSELLGNFSRNSASITFTPIIPFMLDGQYSAACGKDKLTWTVPIPEDYSYAEVLNIYPTASELPCNLLKFHIRFSQPMMELAYQWIELLDERGTPIDRAFLTDIPELWNEDRTVLSLWIEPGRIKRGLGPHEKLGPVLKAGESYTAVISANLRDRKGVPMKVSFKKQFEAGSADREIPRVDLWRVHQVLKEGKKGIRIDFNEAMDIASSVNAFSIAGVAGSWSMLPGEKSLLFIPDDDLNKGTYTIIIDPKMEDLAGNNLRRLFDSHVLKDVTGGTYELTFKIE